MLKLRKKFQLNFSIELEKSFVSWIWVVKRHYIYFSSGSTLRLIDSLKGSTQNLPKHKKRRSSLIIKEPQNFMMEQTRQWPEVSDFVTRCTSKKTHGQARIARKPRAFLQLPWVLGVQNVWYKSCTSLPCLEQTFWTSERFTSMSNWYSASGRCSLLPPGIPGKTTDSAPWQPLVKQQIVPLALHLPVPNSLFCTKDFLSWDLQGWSWCLGLVLFSGNGMCFCC